ncbi:hypothetical protein [Lacticaseibacillus saniviri]
MRFIERIFLGLGYHRKYHIIVALLSAVFIGVSLFFLTIQNIDAAAISQFNGRLHQFSADSLSQADQLIQAINNAHQSVIHQTQVGLWLTIAIYSLLSLISAWVMTYRRFKETASYLLLGKSQADITAQYMFEASVTFTITFFLLSLVVLLFSNHLVVWWQGVYTQQITQQLNDNQITTQYADIFKQLFSNQLTGFTPSAFLYPDKSIPLIKSPTGFIWTYCIGLAINLLTNISTIGLIQHFTTHHLADSQGE